MNIVVHVKPRSSQISVMKISDSEYRVKLTTPPVDGEANDQLLDILSEYFQKPKSRMLILRGMKSKKKVIKIW